MNIANDPVLRLKVANLIVSNICDVKTRKDLNTIEKMTNVLQVIIQAEKNGITTRKISCQCDMTIYAVRRWLILLEKENIIQRNSGDFRAFTWTYRI